MKKDILKFLWNKNLKFCILFFAKKLKICGTLHKFRSSTLTLQHILSKIKFHLDSLSVIQLTSSKCQQRKNRKFLENQKRDKSVIKSKMQFQNMAIFPIPSPKCGGIYSGGEVLQPSELQGEDSEPSDHHFHYDESSSRSLKRGPARGGH